MLHNAFILFFIVAGGLTLSGLVVTTYRLFATLTTEDNPMVYYPVIAFAGPSVLMENATKSLRTKQGNFADCVLAGFFAVFWSSILGLPLLALCGAG
jgi:hypothetical protein